VTIKYPSVVPRTSQPLTILIAMMVDIDTYEDAKIVYQKGHLPNDFCSFGLQPLNVNLLE
jgi:hypothetical protein